MTLSASDLQGMKERHRKVPDGGRGSWMCEWDADSWPCDFERLRIAYEERGKVLEEACDHLLFNAWKDDPGSDRRTAALLNVNRALNPNTESEEGE